MAINRFGFGFVVLLLTFTIYFVSIDSYILFEPDEARNMEIAREMVVEGKIFPPTVHGRVRYEKPPLYYYTLAISYKIFGHNEYSGRFLSAISTILTALGTFIFARRFVQVKNPFIPPILFLTTIPIYIHGRLVSMEPFLTMLIFYSVLFFVVYIDNNKNIWAILSFIFVSLAFCVKGPIAIFYYLIFLTFYSLFFGLKFRKIYILFPLILFVIAFPLFYIQELHFSGYIYNFFIKENFLRYTKDIYERNKPFYYYFVLVPVSFGAWGLLIKDILSSSINFKYENEKLFYTFLFFILVPIIVFSFSKSKMLHYVFPVFPFVSMVISYDLDSDKFMKIYIPYIIVFIVFSTILFPIYTNQRYDFKYKLPEVAKNLAPNIIYYRDEFYSVSFYLNKTPYVVDSRSELLNKAMDLRYATIFVDVDREKDVFDTLKYCNLEKIMAFRIRGHNVSMINADCL